MWECRTTPQRSTSSVTGVTSSGWQRLSGKSFHFVKPSKPGLFTHLPLQRVPGGVNSHGAVLGHPGRGGLRQESWAQGSRKQGRTADLFIAPHTALCLPPAGEIWGPGYQVRLHSPTSINLPSITLKFLIHFRPLESASLLSRWIPFHFLNNP